MEYGIVGWVIGLVMGAVVGGSIAANAMGSTGNRDYWFKKYGTEVCKQRSSDLHSLDLGKQKYWVCMDRNTKVLSDFD
jgi:hypothetical protein